MELKRLKLELEAKRLETAACPAGITEEVVQRSLRIARSPELPAFVDGRMISIIISCDFRDMLQLQAGKRRRGYSAEPVVVGPCFESLFELLQDEAVDYERLKLALLKRYDFKEFGCHRRFCDVKPEGQESPGQFILRLKNNLTKWVKLAKVEELFDEVVREQFTNACPKELSVYLNERSSKTLDELTAWEEQY